MKIDMHVHTRYSHDGVSTVRQMFKEAKKRGLDGLAVTDHYDNRAWEEARKIAEDLDMYFIPGEEVKVLDDSKGEICEALLYFLDEGVGCKKLKELREEADRQDALMFLPHPYSRSRSSPEEVEPLLDYFDGIETINARSRFRETNRRAIELVEKMGVPAVGGSDAHIYQEIGYAHTEVEGAEDLDEFKRALRNGEAEVKGRKSSRFLYYASLLLGRV